MALDAANLRILKKFVRDRLATITDIGTVLPSRFAFAEKANYWATVGGLTEQTRKQIETSPIAFCLAYIDRWEYIDPISHKSFDLIFAVRPFRESFPARLDESFTPDEFLAQITESEDKFDAAYMAIRAKYHSEISVPGMSGVTVILKPVTHRDSVRLGYPEYIPKVPGFFVDYELRAEVRITDEC